MRNFDFSPLYRSAIGFDRMASLLDAMNSSEQKQPSYPPYDIELTGEDSYRITMAVAGFEQSELDIQVEQNRLSVSSKKPEDTSQRNFLHRGIAARNFERRFQLADHVKVTDAKLANGLLHIELVREIPEAMKPRKIQISEGNLLNHDRTEKAEAGKKPDTVAA
ncbi:Hsp20 family protein [Microbulbifer sp. THAF38]|uniref:Hsp20 family protein n=1 Tax=unclassified Microbulbifer TaxID=2619833 RepID=UPI001267A0AF|nr:Hsp20 family protein [Microbulbifer sp. THAF38]QFT55486.1 Small heat shock protein IbpA [Microbulbifer sp. THAF38]